MSHSSPFLVLIQNLVCVILISLGTFIAFTYYVEFEEQQRLKRRFRAPSKTEMNEEKPPPKPDAKLYEDTAAES